MFGATSSHLKQQQQPQHHGLYTYVRFGLLDSLWIVGPKILGPLLEEHDERVQQPI